MIGATRPEVFIGCWVPAQGTLPGSWGYQNSMNSVRTLNFLNNNLSGPIPQGWQVNSNGQPHFVNLQSLSLLPGAALPSRRTAVSGHPVPCTALRPVLDH